MSAMKPKQVRMNLNEECQEMWAELTRVTRDLPESQLATLIMTSGLRALKARGYHLTIPLHFAVCEEQDVSLVASGLRR